MAYHLSPGIYWIKNIPQAFYTMGDHEGTLQTESNDFSIKIKSIFTPFSGTFER